MSLIKREDTEAGEKLHLASHAAFACESRGRLYPQPEHPLRTAFQRDRDRIIHSAAFRRMEYKTQVFLPHEADHFRTRLTHTLEVAQIARTLARCLGLNEDLTEAVALAHDLGHTPFGHAGEDVLDNLLADSGGFNHNRQSLRVVDVLERRYPGYPGLNLSYEVREGIAKHETKTAIVTEEFTPEEKPTLEAALVDVADEIAYSAADCDDGINSSLITFDDVARLDIVTHGSFQPEFTSMPADLRRYALSRALVNQMATDLANETSRQIRKLSVKTLADVRRAPERLVRFSSAMQEQVLQLKEFLYRRLYKHEQLLAMSDRARVVIETLYAAFIGDSSRIPERFQEMLVHEQREIVIADYIAGMTDRYAERSYAKIVD